jgi:putative CocE/NonD family hydrolase
MRIKVNVLGIAASTLLVALSTAACDRTADSGQASQEMIVEHDVAVPVRDGTVLRADIYRPNTENPLPVLLYRTPYGKHHASDSYETHLRAVERGYVVVLQDVRGRYTSEGLFNPYRNEGQDGYDSIEWAAKQPWSNGDVGTYGLSYPGAVQWLAAVQSPPHLKAMVPAMTFSSPRNFFYMNGVFDMSWLPWIYLNIAPDARVRLGVEVATDNADVADLWRRDGDRIRSFLPLRELPFLRDEAPFYFTWLQHSPTDEWWNWAEIRGRYDRTDAAVLNLSGWYDEAYGPEGAVTNHNGLVAARPEQHARSHLLLGPWQHGVIETSRQQLGELDFGPHSGIDYDEELLRFFDQYLKKKATGLGSEPAVRYFTMGANEWRTADGWPPADVEQRRLALGTADGHGVLIDWDEKSDTPYTAFDADPANPVVDPYGTFEAHDFQQLSAQDDVLVFDTPPLAEPITVAGSASTRMFVSCDCADFDLWVRLLDVYPDGRAINLMSPGADVQRMSYRDETKGRQLLIPGEVYAVVIDGLLTSNRFEVGHRIRIQVSASFAPHLSRNLQTGESEVVSSRSVIATITVHHNTDHRSSLVLPVIP